jgi:hypothetical protein
MESVAAFGISSFSSLNKACCLGEFHLLYLLPSSSPAGRGGEGRGRDAGDLGLGTHQGRRLSAASASSAIVVRWRPLISAVNRRARRFPQQGTQAGYMRPAPASVGRRATIFDDNLLIWRPFFDFEMASIASLTPSGLFPGGEVACGRLWNRRIGGDRGPDRVFLYLFRVLRAFLQDHVIISFFFWVPVVIRSVTAMN